MSRGDRVARIVLFDNASDDRDELIKITRPIAAELGGRIVIYTSDENLGFGRAINQAVGSWGSECPRVLIANPDISLTDETIETLSRAMDTNSSLGAVAPVTVRVDGNPYQRCWTTPRSSLRDFLPPRYANLLRLGERQRRAETPMNGYGLWLEGSIVLLRSEAFRSIDGFDESFFLYAEDEDLCKRLVAAGWQLSLVDAGEEVVHFRGASRTGKVSTVTAHYHASSYGYLAKWYGSRAAGRYRRAFQRVDLYPSTARAPSP